MPYVRVNDIDMYYERHGEGPPLVLVEGLGAHMGYWAPIVEALSRRHTLVMYDNRGAGRSAAPAGPYSVGQMADDLLGLLGLLGHEQIDLLGHSMGGYIAMHLAAHHAARVRRLVLYSTGAAIYWPARRFIESIERVWTECPTISSGALTRIFTPWSWSPALLADNAQVETMIQLAEMNPYKMTLESFRAQMNAIQGFDGEPLLERITAPSLVLAGEHDAVAPPSTQRHLADALKAPLVFSQAGHNTHLESPQWFTEQVLKFTLDDANAP